MISGPGVGANREAHTVLVELTAPAPRPYGVSAEEAIELCRDWMVWLGDVDAVVAAERSQHLCALYGGRHLAWVHHSRNNLDVDLVERAARVSADDGRWPLVFVRGGVLPVARQRADSLGVALLEYSARDGSLDGANELGRRLCGAASARP